MFNKVNNKVKKAIAVSLSLVSVMSSMTSLAIKPYADWQENNDGTMSFIDDATGLAVVGWQQINGNRYYFDQAGIMVTNQWQQINGNRYYFDQDGRMVTGWQNIIGWQNIVGWEYVDGWQQINDDHYFYEDTEANREAGRVGQLATNQWQQDPAGNWRYLGEDGIASQIFA